MARLRRFITSYVGLVVSSLVVILISMNALAARQTEWLFGTGRLHTLISFAPLDFADYTQQLEARSIVISFDNGVAGGVRQAVTSLASAIPAVSQRLIDEARRDDAARATLAAGSAFGLSADAARAVAAQAVAATGVVPPPLAGILAPPTPLAVTTAVPTVPPPRGGPAATATGASNPAPTQTPVGSPTATRTSTPTATPGQGGGGIGGGGPAPATQGPAGGQTPVPTQAAGGPTLPPGPPTLVPTAPAAPSPTAPIATPAPSATSVPIPTATPVPPPAPAVSPTPTLGFDSEPAAVSPTPTVQVPTPAPTATPPEFAMDLSVPGGSSISFQPIFSGTLEMKAGETISRTVNVQNNGTRTFRYYLNTSGGGGLLWSDPANGLQMRVQKNGVDVYTGPLEMPDQLIGQLARGGQDALVITVSLPNTAGNAFQGLSTAVSYNFTAVAVP